jgi:hypothetical protein
LTYHKGLSPLYEGHVSRQDIIESECAIEDASTIKETLIDTVHSVTTPVLEAFNFWSMTRDEVKAHIKGLFDPDTELPGGEPAVSA